ncbi:MAG: M20/M25/M40 family metallo-hydrolase [Terriglobales bacterium]|jgi:hypothetical protein
MKMKMKRARIGIVLVLAVCLGTSAQQKQAPADVALNQISPSWIAAHIRFLADSLLEGRETATRGQQIAALYVASYFEALGLKPATPAGFIQKVPLRKTEIEESDASMVLINGDQQRPLEYHKDFLLHPSMISDAIDVTAPVVFVGWGVTDPEQHYDDYAGVDAKGKIVAMFFGGPASTPSDERGYYSLLTTKEANAYAHGAVGIVTLLPGPGPLIEEKINRQLDGFGWLDNSGKAHARFFEEGPAGRLTMSGIDALFAGTSHTVKDLAAALAKGPQSFDLPVKMRIHGTMRHSTVESQNVVAVLPGSDPVLRNEYVVYSAHMDHVGIGPAVNGDTVYHGALDNAGGTATIMAAARAFASLPKPPKRSLIFVAVTGEEKGILGSDYFVHNPPVPLEQIVADINCDNFLMLYPVKDIAPIGAEYSTLMNAVKEATAHLGIAISADAAPDQMVFTRSDHFPFMVMGVPGVFFFNGVNSGDGKRSGGQVINDWLGTVHHTPKDTVGQGINWDAAVSYTRLNFLVGYDVANDSKRPQWTGHYFFQAPTPATKAAGAGSRN